MTITGFGNQHQSEAIVGALPYEQNSPQRCPMGLYAEQLSGSAFTRARHLNLKSWLYRILPSVMQSDFKRYQRTPLCVFDEPPSPNPLRWSPLPHPKHSVDFIDGLFHVAGNITNQAFVYQCNRSMAGRYFNNRDGEMLIVPYQGELLFFTEFGKLTAKPGQIIVIPRGVSFKVELLTPLACGYICENGGSPLTLPQLGPIGANGLANPRHFIYPNAAYEEAPGRFNLICKYKHHLWQANVTHSPLNVVAWAGNLAPYSYDLALFNTINTVSYDHPDPSIFTVLTSESDTPGVSNIDFVIFPTRWMVAEHTFRPPYYHRNIMSELMGLVYGQYDAKQEGFAPGGISIHNSYAPHGPDYQAFTQASEVKLQPEKYDETLAIMFETKETWSVSKKAMNHGSRQTDYSNCWQTLERLFVM